MNNKYGWVYRNYFPAKGCFYDGSDAKNLYSEKEAIEWHKNVGKYIQEIEIIRPPKQKVKIKLPLKEIVEGEEVKEDKEFINWVTTAKIEPKMGYVIDQVLDEYYLGIDGCFYKRPISKKEDDPDKGVVFTMREVIDGMFRLSPIQVRTFVEKETQKVNFLPWELGEDVFDVPFSYQGKQYTTNFFGLYGAKFREAIFPNSSFDGSRLMKRQRESMTGRGNITIIKAPRSGGKCSAFGSDIRLYDGTFKKAEELVVGDKLLSSNRKGYVTVKELEYYKKEVNKITLANGMEKIVSFDHRIPTEINYSRDGWDLNIDNYKRASEINIGDHLATNIGFNGTGGTYREGLLVGSFLGDGGNNTQQISCRNEGFAEYILSYTKGTYLNGKTIQIHKEEFNKDEYCCNGISYNKYIDNKYFGYSNDFKRGMVCGLIATDGYITKHSSSGYIMGYCSTSEKLARGFQTILADLGIFSTFNKKKFKSQWKSNTGNIAYTVTIANNYDIEKIIKNVNLSYKKNYQGLVKSLGESIRNTNKNNIPLCAFDECEVKPKRKKKGNDKNNRSYFGKAETREPKYNFNRNKCIDYGLEHRLDYSRIQVQSNENMGLADVVHIAVDGDHTYYDGNILTHNSLMATSFIASFLWKELNMAHEYDRPFLIVYGGLSKEANLQVVDYLRAMSKRITTNKNILNWNKGDQILTLYDGYNERKIKFVSQGQEGQGFTGLRPHLVVLDEAARLEKRMYDVAAGTIEAPIIIISTTKAEDKRNWFEDMYKDGVARQRNYEPVEELIKGAWIKFGMHKIKSREEMQKKINNGIIDDIRQFIHTARPLVSFKYTIYDVEYLSKEQQEAQIEKFMASGEDICLAELFNELVDSRTIFNTDGLIESNIPDKYDRISCAFDEAEEHDNPAFVAIGYKGTMAYVFHSEILDKSDYVAKYKRISELLNKMKSKAPIVTFAADLTRVQRIGLREITDFVREPDFPILYTSAKHGDINRKRPFYLVPKERMITIAQDEFFKKGNIIFDNELDITGGLIEELSNFKRTNKGIAKGHNVKSDDQVNGMMMALFALYWGHVKDIEPTINAGMGTPEERYDAILSHQKDTIDMDEYERKTAIIVSNFR